MKCRVKSFTNLVLFQLKLLKISFKYNFFFIGKQINIFRLVSYKVSKVVKSKLNKSRRNSLQIKLNVRSVGHESRHRVNNTFLTFSFYTVVKVIIILKVRVLNLFKT